VVEVEVGIQAEVTLPVIILGLVVLVALILILAAVLVAVLVVPAAPVIQDPLVIRAAQVIPEILLQALDKLFPAVLGVLAVLEDLLVRGVAVVQRVTHLMALLVTVAVAGQVLADRAELLVIRVIKFAVVVVS
jgi:hypothetical protein